MARTNQQASKQRLLKERAALVEKVARLREDIKVELEFEADEGDPELPEREKNLLLLATFEEHLEEVDLALDKLSMGRYGICLSCGKPIPPERLAILPEAQYCVPCKSKRERRRR